MTDHLEEYLRDAAPVIEEDHRNLQRAALREVIKLSAQAVRPAQDQVESQYQTATKSAQARFDEAREKLDADFQSRKNALEQSHQNSVDEFEAQYQSEMQALDADAHNKRSRLAGTAESREQRAAKHCEYETLLADNIAEGAIAKHQQERQALKIAIPAAHRQLETLSKQADDALRRFRQPIPADQQAETDQTADLKANPQALKARAQQRLEMLRNLAIPRLFVGLAPYLWIIVLSGGAVGLAWALRERYPAPLPSFTVTGPAVGLIMLAATLLLGKLLRRIARSQVKAAYLAFRQARDHAEKVLGRRHELALKELDQLVQAAEDEHDAEIRQLQEQFAAARTEIANHRQTALQQFDEEYRLAKSGIEERRLGQRQQADREFSQGDSELQQVYERDLHTIQVQVQEEKATTQDRYDSACLSLQERWQAGLACIEALLDDAARLDHTLFMDWNDPSWPQWTPSHNFSPIVRFGQFHLDLSQLATSVREQAQFDVSPDGPLVMPALLAFPDRGALLLQTRRQGRDQAIGALRAAMVRLFTTLPPGKVRFTIIDPKGLGENFAGFMHLADYEEALVGRRIWTEPVQIQQQLEDLTHHMENVIQKYLRNEFETIEAYNHQAGELAEPYRFLVIADFPSHFNDELARRLASIVHSGARCGVYTLIAYDARQELPPGIDAKDLAANSAHLLYEGDQFVWQDEVFRRFPLTLDAPPAEEVLTGIMHRVGGAAQDSTRVEVPFDSVAPKSEDYWSADSSKELCVPVGRTGATRLQHLRLGRDVAQHLLIAGKTGSGKSTLLHVIITNLALWYAPDQVELYLIDFKKGVEFKTYVTHQLAHARVVAIESDREFGLSILQRLDGEMTRRGDLFRQAGVQDIAAYRQATGTTLARCVLIVDEFQVFFAEDDRLAQDAALLLEQLVRQGRAFGIHVLLGSQTLAGAAGLPHSTTGQMAVRIALQCSEVDSQLIFDDNNSAARLLSRPGEAIYNDASGVLEGNSPFQTAWLSDSHRDQCLTRITELAEAQPHAAKPLIVFEGNVPADITDNRLLANCLEQPQWPDPTAACAWLGEPVAIKEPTAVFFRRQNGANLLIIGQRHLSALGVMNAALISLAAQHAPADVQFVILEGTPADAPQAGALQHAASLLPHQTRLVEWRRVPEVIDELMRETQRRLEDDRADGPTIHLLIYGLQRYRVLRKQEDDFSFSVDAESAAKPDKLFAELLREGPPVGIHTLVWADSYITLERTLNRQTLREFDNRVLFQMSAADSSNLIDSPIANQLGFQRALFYSEESGILEKFRPYAPADPQWLDQAAQRLAKKSNPDRPAKSN